MEVVETVSYVVASILFFFGAMGHLKNHDAMVGFAEQSGFPVPYVAGWPTGVVLAVIGVLVAFGTAVGFWAAAGFLVLSGLFFHRNLQDPGTYKQLSLAALFVALATLI